MKDSKLVSNRKTGKVRIGSLVLSLVMIRLSIEDGIGSIELLNEDETNHLVGEGHWGKGDFLVGSGIDFGREAVRSSNDEDESLGNGVLLLLNPVGKVDTAKGLAMLIQQDKVVGGLELAQDKLSFTSLLLVGCEGLGVFQFGNGDDVKSHIVLETSSIVVDESLYVGVGCAAYEEKEELHGDGEWGAMNPSAELKGTVVEEFMLSELRS